MKKSFFQTWFINALIGSIIISSCSSGKYKPSEYISATGITNPEVEIKIELEDGAAIIIPANATNSEVTVTVERNPEKANSLPPLDESVVKVGDFYNFEIDGTLHGPVDLVLPFDPNSVPESEEGILVVAIPTETGWDYIPVVPNGNKVTLYTNQLGDPLIAWHFSNSDEWDKQVEEMASELKYCNPTIALNVVPESGDSNQEFTITGRVIPLEDDFITTWSDNFASFLLGQDTSSFRDLPVEIVINNDPNKTVSTRTNQDGSFEVKINPEQDSSLGFNEKVNWLQAKAKCTSIVNPNRTSEAIGHSSFYLSPKQVQVQSTQTQPSETQIATAIPISVETPIPAGAVLLPDFVGQDIDTAIDWLTANGFKYTWIDGSSPYDLGTVYNQAPTGGQYKVPHRTVVVLYRTTTVSVATGSYSLEIQEQECPVIPPYGTTQCKYQPVTIPLSFDVNSKSLIGETTIVWEVTDYIRAGGVLYPTSASASEMIRVEGKITDNSTIEFKFYYSGTTIPIRDNMGPFGVESSPSFTFVERGGFFVLENINGAIFTKGSVREYPSQSDFIQLILHIQN